MERQYVIHKLRQRLIHLWRARTKYRTLRTLCPKQKRALELWEHMQDCRDKKCKRNHCRSSHLILGHYNRLEKSSSIELCAQVTSSIVQDSRGTFQMTSKQYGATRKRKLQRMDQDMICEAHEKKAFVSESGIKRQHRTSLRWDKSVMGKEHPMLKFIQTTQVKDYPLRLRQTQQHLNNQTLNLDKATNTWNPNQVISSETKSAKNSLSEIRITCIDNCITEEDRQAIIEASIILSRLKKR